MVPDFHGLLLGPTSTANEEEALLAAHLSFGAQETSQAAMHPQTGGKANYSSRRWVEDKVRRFRI